MTNNQTQQPPLQRLLVPLTEDEAARLENAMNPHTAQENQQLKALQTEIKRQREENSIILARFCGAVFAVREAHRDCGGDREISNLPHGDQLNATIKNLQGALKPYTDNIDLISTPPPLNDSEE